VWSGERERKKKKSFLWTKTSHKGRLGLQEKQFYTKKCSHLRRRTEKGKINFRDIGLLTGSSVKACLKEKSALHEEQFEEVFLGGVVRIPIVKEDNSGLQKGGRWGLGSVGKRKSGYGPEKKNFPHKDGK